MKKMKLIPVALLIFLSLSISSCNKELPLADAILGTWEVQEKTVLTLRNNVKQESYSDFLSANEEVYQFVKGGSGIYYEDTDDYAFSWTLTNNTLIISDLYVDGDLQLGVLVDGDILVMTYEETDEGDPAIKYEYSLKAYRID